MAGCHRNFRLDAATLDNLAPLSAPERRDQRRQEVVAIFGRKPPCAGRALNDGDKDVAA